MNTVCDRARPLSRSRLGSRAFLVSRHKLYYEDILPRQPGAPVTRLPLDPRGLPRVILRTRRLRFSGSVKC